MTHHPDIIQAAKKEYDVAQRYMAAILAEWQRAAFAYRGADSALIPALAAGWNALAAETDAVCQRLKAPALPNDPRARVNALARIVSAKP